MVDQSLYEVLSVREYEYCYKELLKVVLDPKPKPSEIGWTANWQSLADSLKDKENIYLEDLTPKYFDRQERIFRYHNKFIRSTHNLEEAFLYGLRAYLERKYLSNYMNIYEFGAGTNHNLYYFAEQNDYNLFSYDWAESSQEIARLINDKCKFNITYDKFDMKNPTEGFKPKENSVLYTSGSMEQLGDDFKEFAKFAEGFSLCVHIEPIIEFYDVTNTMDCLAYIYHKNRKYLGEFFTTIKNKTIEYRRCYFGNFYNEGYNIIVWRP